MFCKIIFSIKLDIFEASYIIIIIKMLLIIIFIKCIWVRPDLLFLNLFWIPNTQPNSSIYFQQDFTTCRHSYFFSGQTDRDLVYWPNHSWKLGFSNKKKKNWFCLLFCIHYHDCKWTLEWWWSLKMRVLEQKSVVKNFPIFETKK